MLDNIIFKDKTFAVFGLGKSGIATIDKLQKLQANILAYDDSQVAKDNPYFSDLNNANWEDIDYLVMSPGIPLHYPKPHPIAQKAKAANCPIICDIELLYLLNKNSQFIGITGTNGKSTTTDLIDFVLKKAGINVQTGGNIGKAALSLPSNADYYLLEMSSYQLDLIDKTKFAIAAILNITPDHLDRHGNFENYAKSKRNIFNNQALGDVKIISSQAKEYIKVDNALEIGDRKQDKDIYYNEKGQLFDNRNSNNKLIIDLKNSKYLYGKHNWQNMAFCYAICKAIGLKTADILKYMIQYQGLKHRMQVVLKTEDLVFINDSKATNAEATDKALSAFNENIYWILGGQAKEGGIDELAGHFSKIKKAYLIGDAADTFKEKLDKNNVENIVSGTLEIALQNIQEDLKNATKGVVLLSPACASWDQWKSFEARGNYFCKTILENYG